MPFTSESMNDTLQINAQINYAVHQRLTLLSSLLTERMLLQVERTTKVQIWRDSTDSGRLQHGFHLVIPNRRGISGVGNKGGID